MIVTYKYRLRPSKKQHQALDSIVESQRQLYNAALEERIDAYRKQGIKRTYIDQTRGLTEWRQSDPEARELPANLQRATLKRLDNAYTWFLNRMKAGARAGPIGGIEAGTGCTGHACGRRPMSIARPRS